MHDCASSVEGIRWNQWVRCDLPIWGALVDVIVDDGGKGRVRKGTEIHGFEKKLLDEAGYWGGKCMPVRGKGKKVACMLHIA